MSTYFVNTGFFTGESCVPTRQAELMVNPTVAFYPANFNVGDVCELVIIDICTLPFSAIELDLVLRVSLLRSEVVRLSPHQTELLESIYSKEEKQSPTEVYREFNNIMRLSGREQVSHKKLSVLVTELELYGFVEVEQKGRGRSRGVDFYIYQTDSVERKALLDALKDFVV